MPRLASLSVPVVLAVLALTACGGATPDAAGSSAGESPAPTTLVPAAEVRPDRDELALGPDGMGTLVFGEAPSTDPATAMLVLDPDYCLDENAGLGTGFAPGSPEAALWVPIPEYRDELFGDFGVLVADGALGRIDVYNEAIPTTEGVRIGDRRDDVLAAYPDATVVEEWGTDIFVITGEHGTLQIEVARQPAEGPYWQDSEADRVMYLHAVVLGVEPFTVAASENIAGGCPF